MSDTVEGKNAPNSISAGARSQTQLGELTALSQTPSWIYGALPPSLPLLLREGEEGRVEEGEEREDERRVRREREGPPMVRSQPSMFEILKNTLSETLPSWGPSAWRAGARKHVKTALVILSVRLSVCHTRAL